MIYKFLNYSKLPNIFKIISKFSKWVILITQTNSDSK